MNRDEQKFDCEMEALAPLIARAAAEWKHTGYSIAAITTAMLHGAIAHLEREAGPEGAAMILENAADDVRRSSGIFASGLTK